jgi:glycine/D-amino acid oxidase-like deaminating enzyme
MTTYGGHASEHGHARKGPVGWVSENVAIGRALGSTGTTAQVHPGLYSAAMMKAAEAAGARLKIGEVTGVTREGGRATGVTVNGATIAADAVVLALGPWSILATQWLPLPAVFGLKGHSLVFETGDALPADALFIEFDEASGEHAAPEVFPRSDGTTYICGISSEEPLPIDPGDVTPEPGAIARLEAMCRAISPTLAGAKVLARQACFRPIARDGLPLIGAVAGAAGAYIATGHSVWGILNAPATGEAVAELILDGAAATVDLADFDPARMRPFDPAGLRMRG